MTDLFVRNGTVVDGTGKAPYTAAVLIKGDRIAAVGQAEELQAAATGAEVFDAEGQFVLPGLINSHEHLCLKGALVDRASDVLSDLRHLPPRLQGPAATRRTRSTAFA